VKDQPTAISQERRTPDGFSSWPDYWKSKRMPWRTEPEIDEERQRYLAERRTIPLDIQNGVYRFKDIKLNRADVEWLLATHDNGKGPVDWDELSERKRIGVDVRGADLSGIDLNSLPLARLHGGLWGDEWGRAVTAQRAAASVNLSHSNLIYTHLEGSILTYADLEEATLADAHLEAIDAYGVQVGGANLVQTYLDPATKLEDIVLTTKSGLAPRLLDIHWGGANLASVNWRLMGMLGDRQIARQRLMDGHRKSSQARLTDWRRATRANRQLAGQLKAQELNEDANRFAYQAHLCQRVVFRRQHEYPPYLGSLFLDLISGYGYRPIRSFVTYLLVVGTFALAYYLLGNNVTPSLDPLSAVVFSITSFHGRGFVPGENVLLSNPLTVIAAGEAIIGLLIEIILIATFTQRFFAR
jgi:uncharacterized protein YjbI with pentapeptide repeats